MSVLWIGDCNSDAGNGKMQLLWIGDSMLHQWKRMFCKLVILTVMPARWGGIHHLTGGKMRLLITRVTPVQPSHLLRKAFCIFPFTRHTTFHIYTQSYIHTESYIPQNLIFHNNSTIIIHIHTESQSTSSCQLVEAWRISYSLLVGWSVITNPYDAYGSLW